MTKHNRHAHSAVFKAKVALAALKGDNRLAELAQQFEIHPDQVTDWKKQLKEQAVGMFESNGPCVRHYRAATRSVDATGR